MLFNLRAGTDFQHITYKGTGPALNDLLGGNIPMVTSTASEFVELPWPPDAELSAEPAERIWQLAGIEAHMQFAAAGGETQFLRPGLTHD